MRVELKENPNRPIKLCAAPSVKNDESKNIILKEAPSVTVNERNAGPAWTTSFACSMLGQTPADTKQTTISDSSSAQECAAIELEFFAQKLEPKLCGAANDARMGYRHACISAFRTSHEDKEGFRRFAANIAQRLGFNWTFTLRGFTSKARQEAKRALKHGKSARRGGDSCVIDRFHRGKMYRDGVINVESTCWRYKSGASYSRLARLRRCRYTRYPTSSRRRSTLVASTDRQQQSGGIRLLACGTTRSMTKTER